MQNLIEKTTKKEIIVEFLEDIKPNLFKLVRDPNNQVRNSFFYLTEFLKSNNYITSMQTSNPRENSTNVKQKKRLLSSNRNIKVSQKHFSQAKNKNRPTSTIYSSKNIKVSGRETANIYFQDSSPVKTTPKKSLFKSRKKQISINVDFQQNEQADIEMEFQAKQVESCIYTQKPNQKEFTIKNEPENIERKYSKPTTTPRVKTGSVMKQRTNSHIDRKNLQSSQKQIRKNTFKNKTQSQIEPRRKNTVTKNQSIQKKNPFLSQISFDNEDTSIIRSKNNSIKKSQSKSLIRKPSVSNYFEMKPETQIEEIPFGKIKVHQLIDIINDNLFKIETELSLRTVLDQIFLKFQKKKELIKNSKLISLIKNILMNESLSISSETFVCLFPFLSELILKKNQMEQLVFEIFELILERIGLVPFFDTFSSFIYDDEFRNTNCLEILFYFIHKVSIYLLTHKQIILFMRY